MFTAGASDVGSGVDHVTLLFDHGAQGPYGLVNGITLSDSTDSFSDGNSSYSQLFASSTSAGTYTISSAYVYDKAGNYTTYSTSQLNGLGYKTSFTVTDGTTAALPSVVVNAPAQVQEGVDATLNLSLTFKAVSTIDSTVTVTYSPTSTATAGADIVIGTVQTSVHTVQAPASDYTVSLGKFAIVDDGLIEGTETAVFIVKATSAVFANGTDTTTVTVPILDHAPTAPVTPITPTAPVETPAQVGAGAVTSMLRLDATTGYGAALASALSAQVYNGVLSAGGGQVLATAAVSTPRSQRSPTSSSSATRRRRRAWTT